MSGPQRKQDSPPVAKMGALKMKQIRIFRKKRTHPSPIFYVKNSGRSK
jgi:hypothetical protein